MLAFEASGVAANLLVIVDENGFGKSLVITLLVY
jgi:hypothetical protein